MITNLSSSSLGAQKGKQKRRRWTYLLSSSMGAQKENKKDNDECWLIIIFSGCIETKQKKDDDKCRFIVIFCMY
jgi:hypothetical protein